MIKLQDFAVQQGVTDRQVQRLLKKYEAELNGLYQRKGPNGTWLTDEACEILRSKMKQQPIVMVDNQSQVDLAAAKAKIEELQEQRAEAAEKLAALYEWKAEKAQLIAEAEQTLRLLESTKQEKGILEGFIKDAKAEIETLNGEKAEAEGKAKAAEDKLTAAQEKLAAQEEKIQELENRSLWQVLTASFRKKGKKQDGTENQGTAQRTEGEG